MEENNKYYFTPSPTQREIIVPITEDIFPVDNTELVDKRADQKAQLAINNIDDWEKSRYKLACNSTQQNENSCFDIYLHFFKFSPPAGQTINWVDAEMFTEQDIYLKTNRFVGSFIRISYYTTPHRETQKLIGYSSLQLEETPISKISICPNQPGSFLYHWKSKKKLNITNNKLYMKVEFFNSANGKVYVLGSALPVWSYAPEYYIDFWNEEMDYTVISLNDNTRTFTPQPQTWDFEAMDWYMEFLAGNNPVAENFVKIRNYDVGCEMDLYYKELITCPAPFCT